MLFTRNKLFNLVIKKEEISEEIILQDNDNTTLFSPKELAKEIVNINSKKVPGFDLIIADTTPKEIICQVLLMLLIM